jgi:DNA repair protein RadC
MKKYESNIPEITLKYKTGEIKKTKISSSSDAAECFRLMYDKDLLEIVESCIVLFLNRANESIGWMKVSQGGITGTIIDLRIVLATALKCGASGIILSHNHPSDNIKSSKEDENITHKLKIAGSFLDIQLIDHIIIGPGMDYYSFADEGML